MQPPYGPPPGWTPAPQGYPPPGPPPRKTHPAVAALAVIAIGSFACCCLPALFAGRRESAPIGRQYAAPQVGSTVPVLPSAAQVPSAPVALAARMTAAEVDARVQAAIRGECPEAQLRRGRCADWVMMALVARAEVAGDEATLRLVAFGHDSAGQDLARRLCQELLQGSDPVRAGTLRIRGGDGRTLAYGRPGHNGAPGRCFRDDTPLMETL